MEFSVQPCVPADAHGLATTMMSAWYANWHWQYRWESATLEEIIKWCGDRLPHNLTTGRDTKRHQKVVETASGKIVGYARWLLPPELAEKKNLWPEAQVAEPSPEDSQIFAKNLDSPKPKLRSEEMLEFRSASLDVADAKMMKDGPLLVLDYLTVHPDYQRRGVATLLVKSGLEVADSIPLKAYVMASPAGLKVYESHGFHIVETTCIDYSQFGAIEPYVHHFMFRTPNAQKEANQDSIIT